MVFISQIIASPMSFFDTTPTGRILNRFSKDQEEVDTVLPLHMDPFLQFCLMVTCTIIIISAVFPPMLVAVLIMGALFAVILLWVDTNLNMEAVTKQDCSSSWSGIIVPGNNYTFNECSGIHAIYKI